MKSLRPVLALLMGVSALAGCDVPTDLPMLEQRWIIPLKSTDLPVEELLPDGVGIAGDLFSVEVDPFTTESTLGDLCPSCVDGAGSVPPFAGTFDGSESFPADVTGAVLEGGAVAVAIRNGLSFDPTAGGGSVVITITDGPGGKVLGQATISSAMAPGSTVARGITLAGGPTAPRLAARADVTSPGGQATTVDTGQKLVLSVEPVALRVSFATVAVAGRSVRTDPVDLDVSDIGETISDHIQGGEIILDITNPFGVAMTVDLVINHPGGAISRTVAIQGTAVSTTSVPYSADDFRSFLGKDGVTLTGAGSVASAAKPVTVRPDQRLVIGATLDLTLIVG